jgi:hypothetical protein
VAKKESGSCRMVTPCCSREARDLFGAEGVMLLGAKDPKA